MNQPRRDAGLFFVCPAAVSGLRLDSPQMMPCRERVSNCEHTANRFTYGLPVSQKQNSGKVLLCLFRKTDV